MVDAHEDAVLTAEEDAALDKARLTLHDNADGTVSGHFTVPSLAGSILRKVIDQLTAPRRGRVGASLAQAGPTGRLLDRAQRAGQAFTELLEHLPTDRLHGKVAATVVVTIAHEKLLGALGAAGVDTGDALSAGHARRLACGAGLLPAVLGGASQVLDAGRTQRLFTETQRTVLATQHTSCAADGCDRPFAWCELHHKKTLVHGWTHRPGRRRPAVLVPPPPHPRPRVHPHLPSPTAPSPSGSGGERRVKRAGELVRAVGPGRAR